MKADFKSIDLQRKASLTIDEVWAKIRLWKPLRQIEKLITRCKGFENIKASIKQITQNINEEFIIDCILYVLVREIWWVFNFVSKSEIDFLPNKTDLSQGAAIFSTLTR